MSYIGGISRMITGDKINYYRKMVREKIKTMKQKKVILEEILANLVGWDLDGFHKMSERIQGITKNQFIIRAQKLWRQRLEKLWGSW